ncbi:hypothetical protein [Halobellus clavatus]|uniref:SipW-cognate class signal peptide n=1 Tax=Halobellus clavatus TaxID=660517 RepID=A0A1H3H5T9_9EURY|nr:hypothetical protein [Halobellus clavatus]SDY10278.1 hypothetical protein SAMN04487946_106156 [Halobellus clavatus]
MTHLTRRRILAAAVGAGLLTLGAAPARAAAGLAPVELTQTAQIQSGDSLPGVALDWRETVNDSVVADTDLTTVSTDATGGVGLIVDEAVLPGDTGAVTLRATLLDDGGALQNAELALYFALSDTAENGLTEPEREAGDDGDPAGDLHTTATISIWRDMGVGTGNGRSEDIPFLTDGDEAIAAGTLAAVDANPTFDDGYVLSRDGETCLAVGDAVYVSFRWEIPRGAGNLIQGDSARFTVGFVPRRCSEE